MEDRRNLFIARLAQPADMPTVITLRYALERGIEALFQLEDSELDSELLPDLEHRGRVLFTESAEGGAGALRRIVVDPESLAEVARKALAVCHFDPDTGEDLQHATGATERCESACYDCLLSYRNQLDHGAINRHAIRETLMGLAGAVVSAGAGGRSRADQRRILETMADSGLEKRFVIWLDEHGYRLPDSAQQDVTQARARPDLVYELATGPVAVFVDGPPHDTPHQAERDQQAQDRLEDLGWLVIRVRHDDPWPQTVAAYPSVFGVGVRS